MHLAVRIRITFNLALATFTSFVDCLSPDFYPGTTLFLVKKVGVLIDNGVGYSSGVCNEVSASTGESCIVDETSDDNFEQSGSQCSSSSEVQSNEREVQ
jgi:hypothetical protein